MKNQCLFGGIGLLIKVGLPVEWKTLPIGEGVTSQHLYVRLAK